MVQIVDFAVGLQYWALILLVLDLNSNNIVALPNEIKQLSNLEELYLQNNDIQKVSDSICSLENLKVIKKIFLWAYSRLLEMFT